MIKYCCDRCEKDLKDDRKIVHLEGYTKDFSKRFSNDADHFAMDLCPQCWEAIYTVVKGKGDRPT